MSERAARRLAILGTAVLALAAGALVPFAGRPPRARDATADTAGDAVALHREAVAAARAFLEATTAEERIARVRHPEALGPLIRARWRSGVPEPAPGWMDLVSIDRDPGLPSAAAAFFARDAGNRLHLVSLVREDEELRIDWESFVAHQAIPPEMFFEVATERGLAVAAPFRVAVERADYHNFAFSDPGRWTSWRLHFRNDPRIVHGFTDPAGPVDAALNEAVADRSHVRVTLQLRLSPEDAERGLVEITAVVSTGWLTPEPLLTSEG